MAAKISIVIQEDGTTTFEVAGVSGASCEQLTDALVRATGDAVDTEYNEDYVLERPDYVEQHED